MTAIPRFRTAGGRSVGSCALGWPDMPRSRGVLKGAGSICLSVPSVLSQFGAEAHSLGRPESPAVLDMPKDPPRGILGLPFGRRPRHMCDAGLS